VLKTAYAPDWASLVKTGSDGQSQLATLYTQIAAVAKK
jgi:hypothetical protein